MESNKHNIDNFERFLREKTDEFRMYPSKRVWYSIYNNMHPGNRLPSVSMSMILIGFLFLVGYLNTNNANKNDLTASANKQIVIAADNQQQLINADQSTIKANITNTISAAISTKNNTITTASIKKDTRRFISNRNGNLAVSTQMPSVETTDAGNMATITVAENTGADNVSVKADKTTTDNSVTVLVNNNRYVENDAINTEDNKMLAVTTLTPVPADVTMVKESHSTDNTNTVVKPKNAISTSNKTTVIAQSDKAWMEEYGMHNRPAAKKWAGKVSLQAYITPSIVYRTLRSNIPDKIITSSNQTISSQNVGDFLTNKPSFGIETGASLQYDVTKRIKLKAGVQFNYTRYNAHAYETDHPVSTSITLSNNDGISAYESFRTSDYANTYGINPTKLHNETYQFSIPLGADIKLASLDNLSWYAGAAIQPTVILYGKSYIISSDRRNYIQDASLLNRFNLNAAFETYISYKTNSGYTWQLGPQYRAQVFTTNARMYSVEERLQNFGFKIGVTKRL